MKKFNKKSGALLLAVIVGAVMGFSRHTPNEILPSENRENPEQETGIQPQPEKSDLPDGFVWNQVSMLAMQLERPEDASTWQLSDTGSESYLSVRFALPESWNFNGFSVADDQNGKALELGNPFPAYEYSPDIFREFPEGTLLPKDFTPADGEACNVRILQEGEHEWTPEEPYLFSQNSIASFKSGNYENLQYIVRDGSWCIYVAFIKTDPQDNMFEQRCKQIIKTITIAQIVTQNQKISVSGLEGKNFDLDFWVMDKMTVAKAEPGNEKYLEFLPGEKWSIYGDGEIVGAVSFGAYRPEPGKEHDESAIYAQISGADGQFDLDGYKRLISNETYEVATAPVRRDDKHNFGILSYNTELEVYAAFEFDSDFVAREHVEVIAGLVSLVDRAQP